MKISLIVLTMNRPEIVQKAMLHNYKFAGRDIDELIWVDNGSDDMPAMLEVMSKFAPDVMVLNSKNLGVAKGYNRGFAMATGDYVVITGCDMMMPGNWLDLFDEYVTKIPDTGIACIYSRPLEQVRERILGERTIVNGLPIQPALPIERRIMKRELFLEIGYLREDFGLYGWEDVEWSARALKVCREKGLRTYMIPGFQAEHLGTEGILQHDGKDDGSYHAFKRREALDPQKQMVIQKAKQEGYPRINPYAHKGTN